MSNMSYVMCCGDCEHEQEGSEEEQRFGRIYRCENCRQVYAAVLSRNGWKRWVHVSQSDVDFYDLMNEREEEEEAPANAE